MSHLSQEYLSILLEEIKPLIPEDMWRQLVLVSRARAGGKARHRETGADSLEVFKQDEEGGDRIGEAVSFWKDNWQKMFPDSGKGQWTYQHHWRGLSEAETKLNDGPLLNTDNSLHGDLRFTARENNLWGFTTFIGSAAENRKADRLLSFPEGKKLLGVFKVAHPKKWLTIARSAPHVAEPDEAGATSKAFAKFFELAHGSYEMGVWRQSAMEVFIKDGPLKGRLLFQFAPLGGERKWILDRPKSQTPIAESRKLEDVLAELKGKGQKWLVWAKPGQRPVLHDVQKSSPVKKNDIQIAFVGTSPNEIDIARRELFVGPVGKTFNDKYLTPLDLERCDVFLGNIVDKHLTGDDGHIREPTENEIQKSLPELLDRLQLLSKSTIVIALGQTAKKALGDRADFVLPHPGAIHTFGDSGEISRKIKNIRKSMSIMLTSTNNGIMCSDSADDQRVYREFSAKIFKADDEHQIVYGVVLEPEIVDAQNDVVSAQEIEQACHRFMKESRVIGDSHRKQADSTVVECYVAPQTMTIAGQKVIKGSWIMALHISDPRIWLDVKDRKYTGLSIGGSANRRKDTTAQS